MKNNIFYCVLISIITTNLWAQQQNPYSKFDVRHWGVILDDKKTSEVKLEEDIQYFKDNNATLHFDLYLPPSHDKNQLLPAVIFLNGIGEQPGEAKVKSWMIYSSWPRLIATQGLIGISMETDGSRVQGSLDALFQYLDKEGNKHGIDAARLGVYAASANTTQSGQYLMKPTAYKGIKAAVLYYGNVPAAPFRKDLPVLFFIAEGDVRGNAYQNIWSDVLKNKAPWTIKMGSELPHAFDALTNNDLGRTAIQETISFWKNHLETQPVVTQPYSPEREMLEMQYWQRNAKVVELMGEWFKKNPNIQDVAFFQNYGRALFNAGDAVNAELIIKKSLELGTKNNFLLLNLTAVSLALNKPNEADYYLAEFKKRQPIERFHYTNMANTLYQFKKYGYAALYCEKALAIEKKAVDYYNLGCYYAMDGNKDKAITALNEAAELGYNDKVNYETDTDLISLKSEAGWRQLMERLK